MSAVMRMWTGTTRTESSDAYEEYLVRTGLVGYANAPGNLAAYFTRRPHGAELTEFCLVTIWESWDAVRDFAGDDVDAAVFYPEDDEYLVTKDDTVAHYDVFESKPHQS